MSLLSGIDFDHKGATQNLTSFWHEVVHECFCLFGTHRTRLGRSLPSKSIPPGRGFRSLICWRNSVTSWERASVPIAFYSVAFQPPPNILRLRRPPRAPQTATSWRCRFSQDSQVRLDDPGRRGPENSPLRHPAIGPGPQTIHRAPEVRKRSGPPHSAQRRRHPQAGPDVWIPGNAQEDLISRCQGSPAPEKGQHSETVGLVLRPIASETFNPPHPFPSSSSRGRPPAAGSSRI